MLSVINSFNKEYRFLSNFYMINGISVEHEFQAAKTYDIEEKNEIFRAEKPSIAKHLGQKCQLRPDWEDAKVEIMYRLVRKKFFDNPDLAEKLIATGKAKLIEGNHWHDNDFGCCSCDSCKNKIHHNYLGNILMVVRKELLVDRKIKEMINNRFKGYEIK